MIRPLWIAFVLLCIGPGLTVAQPVPRTCPAMVEQALATVSRVCADMGRNDVCYGNTLIEPEFDPDAEDVVFSQVGHIADVADFNSLSLSPMDLDDAHWGVAKMTLQANLPNTVPGQNVTFILLGDVTITDANTDADAPPLQAFQLSTGIGQPQCEEAPQDGLLVQTPEGIGEVAFNINGLDVSMGSTLFFYQTAEDSLRIATLEGYAQVNDDADEYPVLAGTYVDFDLDPDGQLTGEPVIGSYQDEDFYQTLPYDLLEETITPNPGLPLSLADDDDDDEYYDDDDDNWEDPGDDNWEDPGDDNWEDPGDDNWEEEDPEDEED